jgi:AraC-like DNA-binding protein
VSWGAWFEGLHTAARLRRGHHDPDTLARLSRARAFIDAHHAEAIDLEAIARAACLSRFHFLRLFRQAYGETPHRRLQRRRIEAARELLGATELSVTEVCMSVGFESLGSFSSLFAREVGLAPIHYRRSMVVVPARIGPPIPACFLTMFASRAA